MLRQEIVLSRSLTQREGAGNNMDDNELIFRMENLINGSDISIENANYIESYLDESYPDDDVIQDFVTCLALYTPGGGEFLYDKDQIAKEAKYVLNYILHSGV